jgi:hypothetical protein
MQISAPIAISRSAAAAPPPVYLSDIPPRELPVVHRDSNGKWIVPGSPREDIRPTRHYDANGAHQGISNTPTRESYSAADFIMENFAQDPNYRLQQRTDAGNEDMALFSAWRDGADLPSSPRWSSSGVVITPSRSKECHAANLQEQALAISLKDLNFYVMLAHGYDPTTLPGAAGPAQPSQTVIGSQIRTTEREPLNEDCIEDREAMKADIDFFMTLVKG